MGWSLSSSKKKHCFDILILGETGYVDFSLTGAALSNYRSFYQPGENAHGDVLVMLHNGIMATKVECSLLNVCIIDLHLEFPTRLVAIYAPSTKSWQWSDLSPFTTKHCMIMGDFNIDIYRQKKKRKRIEKREKHLFSFCFFSRLILGCVFFRYFLPDSGFYLPWYSSSSLRFFFHSILYFYF
jgi:hypothetical protein